jgi:hypothetical protein
MDLDKVGIVLLVLMLIPLIAVVGPQGLGALAGAAVMVGVLRVAGPKQ